MYFYIYIRAAFELNINRILFLHQYLLLFITVEADAHISTMLLKDGDILMRLLPVR